MSNVAQANSHTNSDEMLEEMAQREECSYALAENGSDDEILTLPEDQCMLRGVASLVLAPDAEHLQNQLLIY